MQQLDKMDIAGLKLGVKIAPMSAGETAQLAAAAARVDLDDEGKTQHDCAFQLNGIQLVSSVIRGQIKHLGYQAIKLGILSFLDT